jgi:pimeloyl-ACP methyl ester carboxylesterase
MKNLKYILSIISVLLFIQTNAQDVKVERTTAEIEVDPSTTIENDPLSSNSLLLIGDRLVFWVHGLGGNVFSWDRAAEYVGDEYKVTSLSNTLDYSTNSLSGAGQVMQNTIDELAEDYGNINEIEDPDINFIIAHSQGGLVSRAAYKRYSDLSVIEQRSFGGIVTFGTPHQGAQILNNVPQFLNFIEGSCNSLSAGPSVEAWNGVWFLHFFEPDGFIEAVEGVCSVFGNKLVPLMMGDYLSTITDDYNVGSEPIEGLNAFDENMTETSPENIPKVAFYGIEDAPVVWRTVYSLMNDVNAEEVFQPNDDDELISIANTNQNSYYMKYLAYKNLYDLTSVNCQDIIGIEAWVPGWASYACNPENLNYQYNDYGYLITNNFSWFPYFLSNVAENRDAYYTGYTWWVNVEETYLSLIGAVDYAIEGCHCDCLEKYGSDPTPFEVLHDIDCDSDCDFYMNNPAPNTNVIYCDYAVVYQKYIKQNDGIVLVESAKDYPGANNGVDNVMLGSNHLQMRNDVNTGEKLDALMYGQHGQYFITLER